MLRMNVSRVLVLAALVCPQFTYAQTAVPAAYPSEWSVAQVKSYLTNAKIIKTRTTNKGVTAPKRVTLSDGKIEHDAVFQAIDEHKMIERLGGGGRQETTELNFVDSYKYNVAAYELATLLEIDYMMPVYVERRWNGQLGSISWFVPSLMDESERLKKKIQPPHPAEWNQQMYRMRVFSSLVRDTDRNLTNVLVTPEWKVMMIDFTRAFRLQPELQHLKDLPKIDRKLFDKLTALDRDAVKKATGEMLTKSEIDAVMVRRDLLIAHFKKLIADLGEEKVLYN